ncbi:MAG: GNAT family N-acetyltransferase [Methylobacteriaceae bacterium]|nr:GNAT family N-acetyltransferase [Methylobacteriaceae bacterium]MBV9636783.1 GNAT family N-acetyltransferase [Methylobacteriaceae bacterium]MBV9701906.1 GNAT family N-acetyltransferase [Methylobacteriaceae bacterium]
MPRTAEALDVRPSAASAAGANIGHIEIHAGYAPVLNDWADLEDIAPISIYQTRRWLIPWLETIGRAAKVEPAFVLVRGVDGRPAALLPFGLRRYPIGRLASFLGGKDANFNLGLFRPGLRWTRADVTSLFLRTAADRSARIDAFALFNQPYRWQGFDNPLAQFAHQPSPSFGSVGDLCPSADDLLSRRFSKDTLKTLRKKARRLETRFGALRHVTARDARTVHAILEAFHAQKSARMREQGLHDTFGEPAARTFLERAATEHLASGRLGIELHALIAGERIVATFGGAEHGGRFSGMFNSFDGDAEIARSSPGELLFMKVVGAKCAEGLAAFDLGIGEAAYKTAYCDRIEALFDAFVPVSAAGHVLSRTVALQRRLKRTIKRSPWLWSAVGTFRILRAGRSDER